MGQAKRRKMSDPNYGKPKEKRIDWSDSIRLEFPETNASPSDFEVDVDFKSFEDSCVYATVTNKVLNVTERIRFHIVSRNRQIFAEAMILSRDIESLRWVGESINILSPIICNQLLKQAQVILVG